MITGLYPDIFFYPSGKLIFYVKPIIFYLKTYLPIVCIGSRLIKEKLYLNDFYLAIEKVSKFSLIISLLQIIAIMGINSKELGEVLGLKRPYLEQYANSFWKLRNQAFFFEPKFYASFIAISLPIFYKNKKFFLLTASIVVGFLTMSQTFITNLIGMWLIFIVFKNVKNIRRKIIMALSVFIVFFYMILLLKDQMVNLYINNSENPVFQIFAERAFERYDLNETGKESIVLGLPLQEDLELPIFKFLSDHPIFILTGYGPGNSTFIKPQYFYGQPNYYSHLAGIGGTNINMRWFYIIAEFGFFGFLFFFIFLLPKNQLVSLFNKNFYSYIWVCFFFSQIDIIFLITAILYRKEIQNHSFEES
jgi:hypothetical protein